MAEDMEQLRWLEKQGAARGLNPFVLYTYLTKQGEQIEKEAVELLEDWNERSPQEQRLHISTGMMARLELDHPREDG